MGEASNFCNRWACQHACKEGRERTVRVTEESNTKTDLSSRLVSRIIMPRMACISAQEEAAQGACAEVVCMREVHIALVITTASFPDVKRSITQKNILCKRKKLPLRGKSDKRINFPGGPRAVLVRLTKSIGRHTNETGQKILPSGGGLRADHRRSFTAPLVINLSLRSQCAHWLWQSVLLDLCAGVLRMTLLRCPKFLRCLTADAGNFDRGHSLTSLPLLLAALSSLPTSARPVISRTPGRAHGPCPTKCVGDPCVPPQQGHPHSLNRKVPYGGQGGK